MYTCTVKGHSAMIQNQICACPECAHFLFSTSFGKIQQVCPFSRLWWDLWLWFAVYHQGLIPLSFNGPSFDAVWACKYTRAYCAQCSSRTPLWLASQVLAPAGGRTESPNPMVRFAYIVEESVFLSVLYIKLYELGLEVTFYITLLKYSHRSNCCEPTNNAFVLIICFCFFQLCEPPVPACWPFRF